MLYHWLPPIIACFQSRRTQMHAEPAIAMARLGYHILLEKPMAGKMTRRQRARMISVER